MISLKALRVHRAGSPSSARLESIGLDQLSPGEVVIRVAWSSVNYKDALAVTGAGAILRGFPRVAGIDLAGTVHSSEAPEWRVGQPVLVTGCQIGEARDGGFAEYARVPASAVVPLPAGLSLFQAMSLGTAGFTAAFALMRMQDNRQSPELGPIAVTGATGGVGSIAIPLFKHAGYSVTAITGKRAQSEQRLRALGADEVIERAALDLGTRPLESARWGGAVDTLGGATLAWLTRSLRPFGSIVSVGMAQGAELETSVMPFILRGISLLGVSSSGCPRPWRLELWRRLGAEWKPPELDGLLRPRIVDLAQVPEVCADMIAGGAQGRTVVRVAPEQGG